jgi:hypothetical protein
LEFLIGWIDQKVCSHSEELIRWYWDPNRPETSLDDIVRILKAGATTVTPNLNFSRALIRQKEDLEALLAQTESRVLHPTIFQPFKDPLEDIHNLSCQSGVVLRGQWYPRDEIQRWLSALADSFEQLRSPVKELEKSSYEGDLGKARNLFDETRKRLPDARELLQELEPGDGSVSN